MIGLKWGPTGGLIVRYSVPILAALVLLPISAFADNSSQIVKGGQEPVSVSVINTGFGGSGIFNVTFTQPDNPSKLVRGDNYTLIVRQSGSVVYNSTLVYGQLTVSSPSGTRIFDMALVPTVGYNATLIVYGVGGAAVPKQSFDFSYENGKYTSTPEFPIAVLVLAGSLSTLVILARSRIRLHGFTG